MAFAKKPVFDWQACLVAADILFIGISFFLSFLLAHFFSQNGHEIFSPRPISLWIYGLILLILFKWQNLYSWEAFTKISFLLPRLAFSITCAFLIILLLRYEFGDLVLRLNIEWKLLAATICFIVIGFGRVFLSWLLLKILRVIPVQRLAFMGSGDRLHLVLEERKRQLGPLLHVVGFIESRDTSQRENLENRGYRRLGNTDGLAKILEDENISVLLMNGSDVWVQDQEKVSEICGRTLTRLAVIPASLEVWASMLNVKIYTGVPVVTYNVFPIHRLSARVFRRSMDVAGGLTGLILSAPIILILTILIKRESPGPVFFKQTRVGWKGKPFAIYKMRSMRLDSEEKSGAVWAVQNDPRRLKIGTFMREKNLDELPQFWNILKGEMSLVGPRPERPEFTEKFKEDIRFYHLRHACKPGLTGWAAVHGFRGNTSLSDRLVYDLYYIEHWSLWLDIKTILMTLSPPKNAY